MVVCICFSMIGIPLCLLCLSKLSGDLADIFRTVFSTILNFLRMQINKCHNQNKNLDSQKKIDKIDLNKYTIESLNFLKNCVEREIDLETDSDDSDYENYGTKLASLITVMIIIFLYIIMGSLMFKYLEGWSLIQSTYFSFTTMSTIGIKYEFIYFLIYFGFLI